MDCPKGIRDYLITKRSLKIGTVLLVFIIAYSLYLLADYQYNNYQNKHLNRGLQEIYKESAAQNTNGRGNGAGQSATGGSGASLLAESNRKKLAGLAALNPDIVGWVRIDHTDIDFPVVQTDNNDYYLKHNFRKEPSAAGAIFMDFRNQGSSDRNIIIYGHNMKDNSMFGEVISYKNKQFLQEHPLIQFDTPERTTYWRIFSVYITDVNFDYIQTDFTGQADFENFFREIKRRSLYDTGVDVSPRIKSDPFHLYLRIFQCPLGGAGQTGGGE